MMDFLAGFFFQLVTKDLHFEHFHPKNVSQTDGGHYSRLVTPDIKSRLQGSAQLNNSNKRYSLDNNSSYFSFPVKFNG